MADRHRLSMGGATVWATILIVVMFSSTTGLSQSVSPDLLKQLPYRHIGPDGNRAIAVVGEPGNPAVTYVDAASGGIFKSTGWQSDQLWRRFPAHRPTSRSLQRI